MIPGGQYTGIAGALGIRFARGAMKIRLKLFALARVRMALLPAHVVVNTVSIGEAGAVAFFACSFFALGYQYLVLPGAIFAAYGGSIVVFLA
tara:strand:- start:85 stop:360 length:276 start_codon:yes stop_codon:yes gene_type:complete